MHTNWCLWFGDNETLPSIGVRENFYGPEVTITAEGVWTFCNVVGNQIEAFKTARNEKVQSPMDFGIVTGWQVHPSQSEHEVPDPDQIF